MAEEGLRAAAVVDPATRAVARLLSVGTLLLVAVAAIGSAFLTVGGHTPVRERGPAFDGLRVLADLAAGRPEGILWASLVAGIALPAARVALALAAFAVERDRRGVLIAAGVLVVVAASLVIALATG